MLVVGFKSDNYNEILGSLRDNGFLNKIEVENFFKEFITVHKFNFDCIAPKNAKIVVVVLINSYNRLKSFRKHEY
tara:strand:+ start:7340 stop:7564 length:225 start_codon:yes stop_codon:yes gene_type:complete